MSTEQQHHAEFAEGLYDRFGTALEDNHWGEYVAISPRGQTIVGPSLLEVAQQASATFGPDNFIFKIGERSVGRLR